MLKRNVIIIMMFITLVPGGDKPPFYGTRYFNIQGGAGTVEGLRITKDNQATITYYGIDSEVVYKGPYKKIITDKDGMSYLITDSTISQLKKNGDIDTGCALEGEPCTAKFYLPYGQ